MRFYILWFFLTTVGPTLASAQSEVKLIVLEKGTGQPLRRVEIRVDGNKTYTDKAGEASVQIPEGEGQLEVYRHSFEIAKVPYESLRNETVTVYLYPAVPADNEVIVQGVKRPEASRKKVSIEEVAKVAPGGDAAQVPKLLPGVQSSSFSPAIVVRGSGPADTVYYVDDQLVPFIFHRIGNISILPPELLSDVEFSSGGFGSQYGGATGGVVTLRTKTEIPERRATKFRVNVPVYSSIYYEQPLGEENDAMVAASIRRSYLEAFLPLVLPENDDLSVVPYFGDSHLYYFKAKDDGHIKVLAMGAFDGLKLVFPGGPSEDQSGRGRFDLKSSFLSLGVEIKQNLNREWSLTTTPQLLDQRDKIDVFGNRIHVGAVTASLRNELTQRLSRNERMYLGLEFSVIEGQADVLAPQPQPDDPFFDFEEAPRKESKVKDTYTSVAAWMGRDFEIGTWVYTPGMRIFHDSSISKAGADPRLNARKTINSHNTFKAAIGQYSQTPQFQETSEDFGNPDLAFIKSYHYILGVGTNWSNKWTTDFQGFYKESLNLVRSDAETNTNSDGSLISAGFEAFIRRNLTQRLFGWLSYTYSTNRERDSPYETYRNSQYDQTHVVNLVGNYKLTGTWDTGGHLTYHTGDTFTSVDEGVYNANLDKYQQRRDPDKRLYDARLPDYHQLDLFATKDVLYDTWKLAWRFGVLFLAAERQAQGVQYNYDFSKREYFRGVPPIPYLEVRGDL